MQDDPALKTFASELWAAEFEGRGIHSMLEGRAEMNGPAMYAETTCFGWMMTPAVQVLCNPTTVAFGRQEKSRSPRLTKTGQPGQQRMRASAVLGAVEASLPRVVASQHCGGCGARRVGVLASIASTFLPSWAWRFLALRMRDHAVVHTPETIEFGWDLSHGWMHHRIGIDGCWIGGWRSWDLN